ncbi:hypothetical protein ACL02U_22430 [Streptomyces sp. MS06]|uniref:hypothetical protein n=1 Tax=Streptomyces sp. MS06 TaxID=3385974 RepID=UPI0039A11C3C
MGIRTLHGRTARAQAQTSAPARSGAEAAPSGAPCAVPPFAAGAATARVPHSRTEALRRAAAGLGRGLARRSRSAVRMPDGTRWRTWADLGLGYLALLLARLPRPRRTRTFTVFVATAASAAPRVGERADGPPGTRG